MKCISTRMVPYLAKAHLLLRLRHLYGWRTMLCLYRVERRCRHEGALINMRLRELISRLGEGEYVPGSSTKAGWLYHDLPLPETGFPTHRRNSISRLAKLRKYLPIYKSRVLDLGCACGGLSIGAALLGAERVLGVDHDEIAVSVARTLAAKYDIGNAEFQTGSIEKIALPETDILLWLSQWMWLVKTQGMEHAKDLLFEIPIRTGAHMMAFESAASDGLAGMDGTTQEGIESFLRDCTPYRRIENIGPFKDRWRKPGQERMVFICQEPRCQWKGCEAVVTRTSRNQVTKTYRSERRHRIAVEVEALRRLRTYPWFPNVIRQGADYIVMEWAGVPVDKRAQLADLPHIITALRESNIVHRDICPDNLLWRNGRLHLIDFSWAVLDGEEDSTPPPSKLGRGYYQDNQWDDAAAAERVVQAFEDASEK